MKGPGALARLRLVAPLYRMGGTFVRTHPAAIERTLAKPALQPYARWGAVYHEYGQTRCADYPRFLRALADRHGLEIESVLDLACGAGVLTQRLADAFPEVWGIDVSDAMIAAARARLPDEVELVAGDFRAFALDRKFDAIVSATDSLNYVGDVVELADVLGAVRRHLRPGGLFVCDALPAACLRLVSGRTRLCRFGDVGFMIHFRFAAGRDETLVEFGDAHERHPRIAIEPEDLRAAAAAAGLRVVDAFSSLWPFPARQAAWFYVLAAP